jgi:hypothetical protein
MYSSFPLDAHQKIAHLLTSGSQALHKIVPVSNVCEPVYKNSEAFDWLLS